MANRQKHQPAGAKRNEGDKKATLEDELDALFKLRLPDFTAARNTLAAQLKQAGRRDDSQRVKALAKPSLSAWAVNQLYWQQREAFDRLIATGQRFRLAQASGRAGKVPDMRAALDERREALSHLSGLATSLLAAAGSHPTPETIHRITTTLEGLSAYASFSDEARPGRLTRDVDPPGFESFASLLPAGGLLTRGGEPAQATSSQKGERAASPLRKVESAPLVSKSEQMRDARIAAAKASLRDARNLLIEARARAQSLESEQKKANAEMKEAEKFKREAEQRFEKARVAAADAVRRARSVATEAKGAAKAVEVAKRQAESLAKELEKVFGTARAR
jgi:hypothetical protein